MTPAEELEFLTLKRRRAMAKRATAPQVQSGPFGGGGFRGGEREQEREGVMSQSGGASGGWGYEDPGILNALRAKFGQGLYKDGFDEGMGALTAFRHDATPGGYLRMPNGQEVSVGTGPDMYRAGRDFIRQEQEAADQHYPVSGFVTQMGGEALGDVALAGAGAAKRGYQTLAGLARGLNMSDAELTPDKATPWSVGEAALSSMFGGVVGNQAPVLMSKLGQTGAAKYLGTKADEALTYSGGKLKDLAGWLKVNSLHPVPKRAEAMAALPGGTSGVGKELLVRNVGGPTKRWTADAAKAEYGKASAAIGELAEYHDAAGGAPIDIRPAIAAAKAKAQELLNSPIKKRAGQELLNIVTDYETKFPNGAAPAADILGMKRELGEAAYGAGEQLKISRDKIHGYLGEGLSSFERATDDALDSALGPRFEAANLASRRLRGASQAAERSASRGDGNQLVSLKNWVAANAIPTLAGGAAGGVFGDSPLAVAIGMGLGGKYGSQAAARSLFTGGQFLQSIPRVARFAAQHASSAPVAQEMLSSPRASSLADLLDLVRQRHPIPMPAYAQGDE